MGHLTCDRDWGYYATMLLRLRNWVVVIGLVFATGLQWAALQSVAWVGMSINYSRVDGLTLGLQKTFSGEHPCQLCKAVQEGRQAEKKQSVIKVETKLDLFLLVSDSSVRPPIFADEPTPCAGHGRFRADPPPVPPPRLT